MKLRNKKTGEVFDALIREKGGGGSYSIIVCDIKLYEKSKNTLDETHFILDEYDSLAELNEDWEDYQPTEPLIKDEKIRKAVRAWAEINLILDDDDVEASTPTVDCNVLTLTYGTISIDVFVNDTITIINHGHYTIAELCGDDEE